MKKLILSIVILFYFNSNAQNYAFSLVQNNGYNFSIVAVPDFDSGAFEPIVQLYGFTLILPTGTTLTVNDIQPTGLTLIGGSYNVIAGTLLAGVDPTLSDKDLLTFATDASTGISIPAHTLGQQISLITFTVEGNPTNGLLTLLDNNSLAATAFSAFESYFTADATDDSVDSASDLYSGQTGMTSFDFSTLGIVDNKLQELKIYPNPVTDVIQIHGDTSKIEVVELYSIAGKLINSVTNNFESIDVKGLDSAVYFLKLKSGTSTKVVKIVKH